MNTKSLKILLLLIIITGACTITYCFNILEDRKSQAKQALTDLKACNSYAKTITGLKEKSSQINTSSVPQEKLTQSIASQIKNLRLNENVFKGINASSQANRVGDSDYVEGSNRVIINEVTLEQLIKILHHTKAQHPGLWVEELNLTAHNGAKSQKHHWDATIKLNYLIYKPIKTN